MGGLNHLANEGKGTMLLGMIGRAAILLAVMACGFSGTALGAEEQSAISAVNSPKTPDDSNPNTRLMKAIWERDHAALVEALKAGATPNYVAPFSEFKTGYSGMGWADHPDHLISALGLAAQMGDLLSMNDIINAGADLNLHARADDTNLPAKNRRATLPTGPVTGLDMAKRLIQRGYRPTAQDIGTALSVKKTPGWEEWAALILDVPGVSQKADAIQAGIDPDYLKLLAERAADQKSVFQKDEGEDLENQIQTAQHAAQAVKDSVQAITGASVGDMVCSKSGVYHTKYVGYVESRVGSRVELRIIGGFNRSLNEFRPQEMHWDDIENWAPCSLR
jgi:hypothetical protein